MTERSGWRAALVTFLVLAASISNSAAQTLTTLANFNQRNGAFPQSPILGLDGNFYGPTQIGGADGSCEYTCGTLYKVTPSGRLSTFYEFMSLSEDEPSVLLLASDGNFYGTTVSSADEFGPGAIFRITPGGTLTTLYTFCSQPSCTDGEFPSGALIEGGDGNFYGTTSYGGNPECKGIVFSGCGTAFRITPEGVLTTLYTFCSLANCTDGNVPLAPLVQAADGNFYGMTMGGGDPSCSSYIVSPGCGIVFRISSDGVLTNLYSFNQDNTDPRGLMLANDGTLWGTTAGAGARSEGSIFRITTSGSFHTVYSFCQRFCLEGANPIGGLIQASDGSFYGTTANDGPHGWGTVFRITPHGKFLMVYGFDRTDGAVPDQVFQATDGTFYGVTASGGANYQHSCGGEGCGTLFSLSVGLGPLVEVLPAIRKVGGPILILGNNLTGATTVNFNGTPAAFSVVSDTEIQTTVPVGATTGFITVTTPSGTLKSNRPFRVIQ